MSFLIEVNKAVAIRSIDIAKPLHSITQLENYGGVRIFLMDDDQPVGMIDVVCNGHQIDIKQLQRHITDQVASHSSPPIYPKTDLSSDLSVSIVIATYDRPATLRRCLEALNDQTSSQKIEIIVVDNHPASGITPPVLEAFPDVILVNESRKGLSYARNAGFLASTGDIILTTDDDVIVTPTWVERIAAPFADPDVMVVTGNTLPLELETEAQRLFEFYGGLGRGFAPMIVDNAWFKQFKLGVPTWLLGATANAAFRANIFSHPQIGLLDESLGAGTPTGCNEDTYLFYKVLKAGYKIIYEPKAYIWHEHRREMSSLRRQLYGYSKGHIAYHLMTVIRDHDLRGLIHILGYMPLARGWHMLRLIGAKLRGRKHYPLSLLLLEIWGNLNGPWALWQSYRNVIRQGRSKGYNSTIFGLNKQHRQSAQ